MSKNSPNNPSGEIPEKNIEKNEWARSTYEALRDAAIKKKFRTAENILNISAVNAVDYKALPGEICDIMMDIRDSDPEKYPGITNKVIQDECSSVGELKTIFLNDILKPLETSRNKLNSHIISSTDITTVVPGITPGNIRGHILELSENEISEYLAHHKKLCRWIEKKYGKDDGTIRYIYPRIEQLFSSQERATFPPQIQEILRDSIERQSHGDNISRVAVSRLFHYFSNEPKKLKKIADFFHVSIHIKNLVDSGIMTDEKVGKIADRIFGTHWEDDLSDAEKKKILRQIKNDSEIEIDVTSDFFSGINLKKITNALVKEFDARLARLAESQEGGPDVGNDIIMGDLNPEYRDGKEIWHTVWIEKLEKLLQKRQISDPGLAKLRTNSVYRWTDSQSGEVFTVRILQEDAQSESAIEPGLRIQFLKSGKNGISKNSGEEKFFSYADFGAFILKTGTNAKVYSNDDFDSILSTDEQEVRSSNGKKIFNTDVQKIDTTEKFKEELDTYIDTQGKDIPIEVGMVFVSKSGEEKKSSIDVAYTILSINAPYIEFTYGHDDKERCTFDEFLDAARSQGCQRIAKIGSDTDFVHALEKYGVNHANLKNGKLKTETHEHDDHGHEKKVEGEYKFFESEQGGHIMMGAITDGWVHFGEWTGTDMNLNEFRDRQKKGKKLTEKEKKNLYNWKTVSYGVFLKYLGENKMSGTTTNLLGDTNADYHGHPPHMEAGLFKRWMRSPSFADIMHGIKGVGHAIEHYLEKGSKLNASRSALKMARMMGLPADIIAQLQADEVGSMKEIIEKLISKLEGQNGPVGRNKALHIVHSKGSRPEEVAAAAMYMVKGYGHLYAEDIKHAQGSESFINALIYACGYTSPAAMDEQKKKARDKFRADMGTEPGQPIQEEEMIWGFLKTIDGNATENPLAGALVKAMGGPSGWERIWRTEGHKGAIEKGRRQTSDIPNAQGRINKYFSALATHEFNTAVGMMENVAGKAKSPDMQGAPIVWCLTGMTRYASTKLAQEELWQFVASKGHSFHAYSFLRNKERNDIYHDVFMSALEGIATPEEILNLNKAITSVQYIGHDDPHVDRDAKKQLKNFEYINSIWKKYEGRGLHDRLQGKNSWLIDRIHTHHDKRAEQYLNTLSGGGHIQMSMDSAPSNDNGWMAEFGHKTSPIVKYTEDKLLSFEWHINKIRKDGSTTYALNKDMYERFWPPIVDAMKNLKELSNSDLQQKQYFQYRKDIVNHFRRLLGAFGKGEATEEALRSVRAQPYYHDLQNMGISIEEFFTEGYSINSGIAEQDYMAWKNGGRGNAKSGPRVDVEGTVANILANRGSSL